MSTVYGSIVSTKKLNVGGRQVNVHNSKLNNDPIQTYYGGPSYASRPLNGISTWMEINDAGTIRYIPVGSLVASPPSGFIASVNGNEPYPRQMLNFPRGSAESRYTGYSSYTYYWTLYWDGEGDIQAYWTLTGSTWTRTANAGPFNGSHSASARWFFLEIGGSGYSPLIIPVYCDTSNLMTGSVWGDG